MEEIAELAVDGFQAFFPFFRFAAVSRDQHALAAQLEGNRQAAVFTQGVKNLIQLSVAVGRVVMGVDQVFDAASGQERGPLLQGAVPPALVQGVILEKIMPVHQGHIRSGHEIQQAFRGLAVALVAAFVVAGKNEAPAVGLNAVGRAGTGVGGGTGLHRHVVHLELLAGREFQDGPPGQFPPGHGKMFLVKDFQQILGERNVPGKNGAAQAQTPVGIVKRFEMGQALKVVPMGVAETDGAICGDFMIHAVAQGVDAGTGIQNQAAA